MALSWRILLLTAGWLLPLVWTILWGVFRGAYAHGGFVWWQHAHHAGLAVLGLAAFFVHWQYGGSLQLRESLTVGAVFTCLLLLITWFSFQAGLAVHDLPTSLGELLFGEP